LMFRLVRFLFSLAMTAALIWFAVSVPLGKRTLWGHLRAIFSTPEAKDLADGTKEEAEKVARRVQQGLHRPDLRTEAGQGRQQPLDPVEADDRRKLQKLVKEKAH